MQEARFDVSITPAVVTAESWNRFTIRVVLGPGGLPAGESFGLLCGGHVDRWHFQFATHKWGTFIPWQVRDPAAPGYLTVSCSRAGVALRVRIGRSGPLKSFHNRPDHLVKALKARQRYVLEVTPDRALRKGDALTILWGDPVCGSPGVQAPSIALGCYFLPFRFARLPRFDRGLPLRQGRYGELPQVRVTGRSAVRFHLVTPAFVGVGERTRLHLAAVDEYGNLDESFEGAVRLKASRNWIDLPQQAVLTRRNRGVLDLESLAVRRTGWGRIAAVGGGLQGESNAVRVTREAPEERLYFGELHAHTLDCDGTQTCTDHFRYARQVAGLDFGSISAHAEYFGSRAAWERYLQDASAAHAPGRFVTFYGYEWAGEGHTNAYFKAEGEAVNFYGKRILNGNHPPDDPPFREVCNRERAFVAKIRHLPVPALCIAHYHAALLHPGDADRIRLYEVYSNHQQNTLEARLKTLLAAGWKMGVVAGSDTHRLPLGSLCPDPDAIRRQPLEIDGEKASQSMQKKSGLMATFARDLGRDGLWDGFWNRRTYGTTGARIVLTFDAAAGRSASARMGGTLDLPEGGNLRFRIRVGGTAVLAGVRLLRHDGRRWTERECVRAGARDLAVRIADPAFGGPGVYFVMVTQADGERAWSSPIWVQAAPASSTRVCK